MLCNMLYAEKPINQSQLTPLMCSYKCVNVVSLCVYCCSLYAINTTIVLLYIMIYAYIPYKYRIYHLCVVFIYSNLYTLHNKEDTKFLIFNE